MLHLLPALLLTTTLTACVTTERQKQAQARTELGAAYMREGNAPAALEVLREAVQKDPRNWEAWDHLGLAYWAQGDFEESEKAFQKGVKLVPEKAELNNNYGMMLVAAGRNAEAIERFEQARKDLLYRKPALVLTNLGYALYLENRFDEALVVLDQALQRSPKLCNAHFNRALVFQALDRLDAALASYEEVVGLCGEAVPGASFHAAELLLARGDREAACAYLAGTIEGTSQTSQLHDAAAKLRATECPAASAP